MPEQAMMQDKIKWGNRAAYYLFICEQVKPKIFPS